MKIHSRRKPSEQQGRGRWWHFCSYLILLDAGPEDAL